MTYKTNSKFLASIITFLMVLGPGLIVCEADNDAGAVSSYIQAGAQYGTHLLWLLVLLLPVTYFIQEMVARLGVITGKGYAAIIYKRFGKAWGTLSLVELLSLNFLTLTTEFAAISLACTKLGINPFISIPLSAFGLIYLVVSGNYLKWERIVITLCLLDVAWLIMAFVSGPNWLHVAQHSVIPHAPQGGLTGNLLFLIIAVVGTTIAPWQLFFQQSCVADKKLRFADLKYARLDTLFGSIFTIIVAGAMMLVGNIAYQHHWAFTDPAQLAMDVLKIYGPWMKNLLLIMMINAAVLGTTAISLSSAWAFGEVKGWHHSLHKGIKEEPKFYAIYVSCILCAAGLVLIPHAPLELIIVGVQVLSGIMLPSALVFLQLLLNDEELIGKEFVNKTWNNVVNWTIIIVLFVLSILLGLQVVLPNLFPK